MAVNKVILVGNLGKDPEVRNTAAGTAVANFSIATSESYKDKDGNRQEKTEWHNIVAWRQLAEICGKYLHKGKQVYIEGKLTTRKWQDQSGVDRYTTEIVADTMQMLGSKDQGQSAGQQQQTAPQQQYAAPQQQYAAPQQQYSAPQQQYAAPQQQYAAPQQQNAAPQYQQPHFNPDDEIPF